MHIRIKQLSAATFFALASIISICTVLIPNTASAAINPTSDRDKTLSYSYYKIVSACSSSLDKDIDTSKSTNPSEWVNDSLFGNANKELKTGFLVHDEGKDNCKALIGKALSFWQIQPVDFLKGVNYSLNSDGTKYSRSSNQTSDFTNYISRTIPGASQETPIIKYTLDYAELTTGCKAQKVGSLATVDEPTSKQATSKTNGYFTLDTANSDGSTTVYVYKSGQEAINNHGTPGDPTNNVSYDCKAVAANVSSTANAIAKSASNELYRTLGNTMFSNLNSLKAADCNAQPNNALRTECQEGWQSAFSQCFAAYENAARLGAKNGPNGNTSEFSQPTEEALNTMALCIADKTGAPALEVNAALKSANSGFKTPTNPVVDDNSTPNDETSCTINGIGWILCPVMDFMGGITDASYSVVATMLTINPSMFDQSKSEGVATFSAWSAMRNFANVAFVIVFLIIIFSQISSLGVTNYGIKKLLPKLIVAAILVNISYYLCAIAVDLSNIIGSSVKSIFDSTAGSVTAANKATLLDKTFSGAEGGNLFATLTGSLIAVAGISTIALYSGLSILLPVLISALVAIVTVVAVLIMRQALIILLIVISPLAFVALLLPNTEGLFKKWRSLLTTLLLMFPIIAAIFGASALAGKIIMSSDGNILVQIMGAGITIIPLFITPLVMRAAGGVLNRFGGFINNPNKGPFDHMRKRADQYREDRQGVRAMRAANGNRVFGGGQFRRQAKRNSVTNGIKTERTRADQQYVAGLMTERDENGNEILDENGNPTATRFGKRVAGGGMFGEGADASAIQRALAGAKFTIDKAEAEEVKAEQVLVANMKKEQIENQLGQSNSEAKTAALLDRLVKISDPGDYEAAVNKYGNDPSEGSGVVRRTLARSLAENGPQALKASDIDNISSGNLQGKTLKDIVSKNVEDGVLSQEKIVIDSGGNLDYAFNATTSEGKERLKETANALKVNENLKGKIKHNASSIERMANYAPSQIPGQGTFF